jgi:hypothetical protein
MWPFEEFLMTWRENLDLNVECKKWNTKFWGIVYAGLCSLG